MKLRILTAVLLAAMAAGVSAQPLRQLAKVEAAGMTLASYGDVPQGARVDYLRAMRTGRSVTLHLLVADDAVKPLTLRVQNYGENPAYIEYDGQRHAASYMSIGESGSDEGVSGTLAPDTYQPLIVRFDNVPARVDTVPLIYVGLAGMPEMDAVSHEFGFSFENVGLLPDGARAYHELKGPVGICETTVSTTDVMRSETLLFNLDGTLMETEPREKVRFDEYGQLVTTETDDVKTDLTYDDAGRLAKIIVDNPDFTTSTVFLRDPHNPYGFVERTVDYYDGTPGNVVTYSGWQVDAYGNWVRRTVKYEGNPEPVTEIRNISYYRF